MKRAFLLIVAPALLVALGFAQTPAASSNTEKTNIKGCLGGAEGNYTVVEDNTGHIFKITASSVDLKAHLGHDVTVIGHRASGMSSADADNGFTVTELNMISEHCAAAATAPAASISTPAETAVTPAAAATAPAASISTPAETAVTPAVAATAPAAPISTTQDTAKTNPQEKQAEKPAKGTKTVTGCLQKGDEAGEFSIVGEDGKLWGLHSSTVKLEDHVGHKVSVAGTASRESKAEAQKEKKEGAVENAAQKEEYGDLRVTSLKMISDTCAK